MDGIAVASRPISWGDGKACCITPRRFLLLSILEEGQCSDEGNGDKNVDEVGIRGNSKGEIFS